VRKKWLLIGSSVALVLLLGLIGVTAAFAQEPPPEDAAAFPLFGGRRGGGLFAWTGGGRWTMFDAAAEALDLTPVGLFTELHEGKTLQEIAEAQGVEMEDLHEAVQAARADAMRQAIEQAVENGNMSEEQAEWMLEGLEQGFLPGGRGFGRGWDRPRPPAGE